MATDSRFSSFHCATPALSQLEDELQHLCHYGRNLILVLGPPGAGRSHVARRLQANVSSSLPVALIAAQPLMTSDQLDHDALRQLGLTQIALVESDLSLAIARAPAGRRSVIVDDAQDLNLHVLRSLLECAVAEREREDPRLTLVLFGDEMLETALAELDYAGLRDNELHRLHLPAFSPDDAQRLATVWAAAQGEAEPDRTRVRAAWQQQHGWPGAILKQLAEQAVAIEPQDLHEDESEFSADVREHPMADEAGFWQRHAWLKLPLIGLGVFILALLLLYQRELNDWLKGGEPGTGQTESVPSATGLSDARRQDLAIDAQPVPTEQVPATLEIIEESTAPSDDLATVPDAAATGAAATTVDTTTVDTTTIDTTTIDTTTAPTRSAPEPNEPLVATEERPATTAPTTAAEPVSKPSSKPVNTPVSKPVSTAAGNTGQARTGARHSADEQALLNASPSYYAVQIIGLRDDAAMNQFIRQHKLDRGLVYHGLRDGKPWQVLVLAPYADRAAAERARDALPEAVRKGGPWIKSIKAIQDEINARAR